MVPHQFDYVLYQHHCVLSNVDSPDEIFLQNWKGLSIFHAVQELFFGIILNVDR